MAQPYIPSGIHRAAEEGRAGSLSRLLAAGSTVDERNSSGTTPLMLSATEGNKRCIKILLKNGASVEAKDVEGLTALHQAAGGGHLAATDLLLAAGANLYAPCHHKQVPFHYAAIGGKVRVMRAMVLAGMDVNYHTSDGPTAFYSAVDYNQIEAVTYLLQEGANPAIGVDGCTFTPLESACRNGGSVDMIRKLIEIVGLEGCGGMVTEVNGRYMDNVKGECALRQAARSGRVDVMDILYTAGARDRLGMALSRAVKDGGEAAVKFLLKRPVHNTWIYVNLWTTSDTPEDYLIKETLMLSSTRVLRLLIDASTDTTNAPMSLLEIFDDCISCCPTESEKQAMLAKRRLLVRIDAVRAVSWGWPADQPALPAPRRNAAVREPPLKGTTTSLLQMLHTMRRREATKTKPKVLPKAQTRYSGKRDAPFLGYTETGFYDG